MNIQGHPFYLTDRKSRRTKTNAHWLTHVLVTVVALMQICGSNHARRTKTNAPRLNYVLGTVVTTIRGELRQMQPGLIKVLMTMIATMNSLLMEEC